MGVERRTHSCVHVNKVPTEPIAHHLPRTTLTERPATTSVTMTHRPGRNSPVVRARTLSRPSHRPRSRPGQRSRLSSGCTVVVSVRPTRRTTSKLPGPQLSSFRPPDSYSRRPLRFLAPGRLLHLRNQKPEPQGSSFFV